MRKLQSSDRRKGVYSLTILLSFALLSTCSLMAQDKVKADSSSALAQDHYRRGMDLLKKGEKAQALSQFSDAADLFSDYQDYLRAKLDSIKPIMESLMQKEPQSPVYNYLMGRWYSAAQRDSVGEQKARSYFDKALQLEPKLGWTYVSLARLAARKGNNEEAAKQYSRAIEANPDFTPAYGYLADIYEQMGRAEEALTLRRQVLKRDSTSSGATMVMLDLARKGKTLNDKTDLFWKAIRLTTDNWLREDAYRELLWTLDGEKPDSAESLARWLLSKNITSEKYSRQTALLAIFYNMKRTHRDKIPAYAEGLLDEKDPRLLGEIGAFCLDSLHNVQVALRCLEGAYKVCTKDFVEGTLIHGSGISDETLVRVADDTRNGFLAPTLGRVYFQLKDYDKAEKVLRESAEYASKKNQPLALYQLGYTLQEKGNKKEAIDWLVRGLVMAHNDKAMAALEKLLFEADSKQTAQQMIGALRRKEAKPAPDFKLVSLKGDSVQLSKLKGKVVMLDFWATWCGPCVSELPNLVKLYKKYENNPGVVFFSIDKNEPASTIKPFMEKNNYSFDVLLGNLTPVSQAFGIEGIPMKFLIDRNGRIEFRHIGGDRDPKVIDDLSREIDELLSMN